MHWNMQGLSSLVLFSVCFAVLQWTLESVKLKWSFATTVSKWANLCYGIASGIFCTSVMFTLVTDVKWQEYMLALSIDKILTADLPPMMSLFLTVYYYSKMWEAVDIVMVTLQGFPINLHFRVHHNTTPLLAWALLRYPSVSGVVFMILNTCMHFFVYLYFGGFNGSMMFFITRFFGHIQLLGGMLVSGCTILAAEDRMSAEVIVGSLLPLVLYITYFALFQLEIRDETKAKLKINKRK